MLGVGAFGFRADGFKGSVLFLRIGLGCTEVL